MDITPERIAIVHDWLPVYAGAERVLEQIIHVYPTADLFSMVDLIPEAQRGFLQGKKVTTSLLQRSKWVRRNYRHFLPIMPLAVEQFDLGGYDLVISSSYAVAKGVITGPGQTHVCYCHSPMRYAWDLQHQYLRECRMERGIKSCLARIFLHYLRSWDLQTSNRVDHFIANSEFVRQRIEKIYRREASIIYPPVNVEAFGVGSSKTETYVTVSRLVPYKMIGVIVEAFNRMPDRKLRVVGDGPLRKDLERQAGPNVQVVGAVSEDMLRAELQSAKAFIFAALEDFGISAVEAQACGTPVIGFGRGGLRETVVPLKTGLFFDSQTPEAIMRAVSDFERKATEFNPAAIRAHAQKFSIARFRQELKWEIERQWKRPRSGFKSIEVYSKNLAAVV